MKMRTVSFFICVMMALTPTADCWSLFTTTTTTAPSTDHHASFSCPDGWTMTTFSTHCLLYVPTKMTWSEAEENCGRLSNYWPANLASVHDSQAAHDIRDVLKSAGHEHGKVWVGGRKTAETASWSWIDGNYYQFYNFCSVDQKHHCLHLTFEEDKEGCLDDMDCETKLPSVCGVTLM